MVFQAQSTKVQWLDLQKLQPTPYWLSIEQLQGTLLTFTKETPILKQAHPGSSRQPGISRHPSKHTQGNSGRQAQPEYHKRQENMFVQTERGKSLKIKNTWEQIGTVTVYMESSPIDEDFWTLQNFLPKHLPIRKELVFQPYMVTNNHVYSNC